MESPASYKKFFLEKFTILIFIFHIKTWIESGWSTLNPIPLTLSSYEFYRGVAASIKFLKLDPQLIKDWRYHAMIVFNKIPTMINDHRGKNDSSHAL